MKAITIGAILAGLSLAACGSGGGGSTTGNTPTPTPTTSPTPTPTPTPPASYTSFDSLTGNQNFASTCAALLLNGNPPQVTPATPYGQGVNIAYDSPTATYTLSANGQTQTFGPADVDPAAPAPAKAYVKFTPSGARADSFVLFNPGAGGSGLTYARAVQWRNTASIPTLTINFCGIGVQTRVNDAPPVTSVSFTRSGITGSAFLRNPSGSTTQFSLVKSTIGMTVNLTTGKIVATMNLIGTPLPTGSGADVDLGTFTGDGDIDPSTGNYYGSWSGTTRPVIGNFGGAFFGPQGQEYGYSFNMLNFGGGTLDFSVAGAVFGAR